MASTPQTSNSKRRKWQATAEAEARKLSATEIDWNLAGVSSLQRTRTRTRARRRNLEIELESPPSPNERDDSQSVENGDNRTDVSSLTTDVSSRASPPKKKPPNSRVIVEVSALQSMLEKHLRCPECDSSMIASFPTLCLASSIRFECTNKGSCTHVCLEKPSRAENILRDADSTRTRGGDCALNVLFVLSFIASGDGATEAGRMCGLLGLPNSTTMKSRSFGNIEYQMSPAIQELSNSIITENLKKEVSMVFGDKVDNEGNKLYDLWLENKLERDQWPVIDGTADMGWQQKGSGRRRNSASGHAFVMGGFSRKIIAKAICSKACGFCKGWNRRHTADVPPPDHDCFKNHEGSSGSMEPIAVLEMFVSLYNERVILGTIVADDDSSIRAKLKWNNEDHMFNNNTDEYPTIINSNGNEVRRPDHGRIPRHMPEPSFVADPNHRRKTYTNCLCALLALPKTDPSSVPEEKRTAKQKKSKEWRLTLTKMDVKRLSKNFAFMIRTLKGKSDEAMLESGKAVLEHHFDNHDHCGLWCRRKNNLDDPTKFYRDKKKDALLYARLHSITARFVELEALKEVAHALDTCVNESFNNTISWLAPKNKVYCGSNSLLNRISIAIGVTSLGTLECFRRLFERLGIQLTQDVVHFLTINSRSRQARIDKCKTRESKRKRKEDEYKRLKKETDEAKRERQKREGIYKSGIGMTGGYDLDALDDDQKKSAASRRKTKSVTGVCTKCGEPGHLRPTNKLCKCYKPRRKDRQQITNDDTKPTELTPNVPEQNEFEEMANEMDIIDSMPLSDASDTFYSVASHYSDSDADVIADDDTFNVI